MVSNTVLKSGISVFEQRRKAADNTSDSRMARLEVQVSNITQQVKAMTTQMQIAIVQALTEEDGIIAKQTAKIN
jgi:hypothetical protein